MSRLKAIAHVLFMWVLVVLVAIAANLFIQWALGVRDAEDHVVKTAFKVRGSDMREQVECEFDPPLKYLTLQMHWYEDSAELNADYILLADPADHDEVWGWSNCSHDEENNSAWCDVYAVKPDFVHADMNVDTIGHEVLHGSCGDFHD